MELLAYTETDPKTFRAIFKSGSAFTIVALLIAVTVQIVAAWAHVATQMSFLPFFFITMFCVVFIWQSLCDLCRKMSRVNWVAALSDTAVYVKFRSYLYQRHGQDDNQIVRIDCSEIEAFRERRITDVMYKGRSRAWKRSLYVELVVSADLTPLKGACSGAFEIWARKEEYIQD